MVYGDEKIQSGSSAKLPNGRTCAEMQSANRTYGINIIVFL